MPNLPLKSGKLVVLVAWLFYYAFVLKGSRRCVQAAKRPGRLPIKIYNSIKYLWALPTPTTFEKVDQTFNFGSESLTFVLL